MIFKHGTFEREFSPADVLEKFEQECRTGGIKAEISFSGVKHLTYCCKLYDHADTFLTQGFGKGLGIQSRLSASCESLEHLWAMQEPPGIENQLYTLEQASLSDASHFVPDALRRDRYAGKVLNWTKLDSVDGKKSLTVPRFIVDPAYPERCAQDDHFPYKFVGMALSTSGQAIGASLDEAALHSLGERIERDCVSRLWIQSFIARTPSPLRIVRPESLPPSLAELYRDAETELKRDILLLDISCDTKVPAYYATVRDPVPINRGGAGASLSAAYACERALLELLQAYSFEHDPPVEKAATLDRIANLKQLVADSFKNWPAFLLAATGDFFTLVDRGPMRYVDFPETGILPSSVRASVLKIAELLQRDCYLFVQKQSSTTGLVLVSTLIPGLEDCTNMEVGQFYVPGPRGLSWVGEPPDKL